MLKVSQLHGFNVVGGSVEVIETDHADTSSNGTSYNFTCDIGAQEAGRKVVVMISIEDVNSPYTAVTSCTINGVSASEIHADEYTGGHRLISAMWGAQVDSGSGNVTVNVKTGALVNSVAVYTIALRNLQSLEAAFAGHDGESTSDMTPTVADCTCPAGGILLGHAMTNVSESCSWDPELTERVDSGTGEHDYSFAWTLYADALAATSITADWTGGGNMSSAHVVALR